MAVRVWKTNLVVENLARQKRTKMWPKWGISSGLIDVWQSEWSVVCCIWIAKPSTKFWPSNWACRKFVPRWSQNFSPMKRRKTEGMCAWTFLNATKMTKILFRTCHNRWWNVDFRIRSWHQTTKFGVAREQLTAPKESKNEQIKTMLICFFDSQGVVHKEFVPPGQTVNKQYYHEFFERLRKRVHRVRPEIADTWMLHHDNAPCHTAISVNECLSKKVISLVPQPPYSPDVSPCDFFLFPKLKFHLKSRHFGTVDNIQKVVTDQLRALLHEDFQHCYREWEQRLRRCVASQGNYFERDNVDL